jgi:hypothetical protein
MSSLILLVLALAAAEPAAAAPPPLPSSVSAPAYPIDPGYWEAHTTYLGLFGATDRWCVKPKDIAKFLSGPSNHIYRCTYPINTAGDGKLHFEGSCADKKGDLKIKLTGDGAYTPTTLKMSAWASGAYHGFPVAGGASADATFIADQCPPGAKGFK